MNKLLVILSPIHLTMAPSLIIIFVLSLAFFNVYARVIEHTFHVEEVTLNRMCKNQIVTTINGSIPGPTIYAEEGDFLVVHVVNKSPYNMTIHWRHTNLFTDSYSGFQRTNVHGALIVYPRGHLFPFAEPYKDFSIILGEWYNENVVELEQQLVLTGNGPNASDAFTINGWPGDMYSCPVNGRRILKMPRRLHNSTLHLSSYVPSSESGISKLQVIPGKTYLLRIINAALDTNHFQNCKSISTVSNRWDLY
ncbi:hypothetical protein Leryth_026764 [Lithospermum erythrorhizon]|nr:hypothetical protein Leryth_026764 [Lithospermum erythrorhizon]